MGDLYERIKEWFDNPENEKKWKENLKRDLEFKERWINKFHNTSPEYRTKFIQKCINKYENEEYCEKEYSKGYEPRCPLYYWLLRYGEYYGESLEPDKDFMYQKILIDNKWILEYYCGQGSFITIYKREE